MKLNAANLDDGERLAGEQRRHNSYLMRPSLRRAVASVLEPELRGTVTVPKDSPTTVLELLEQNVNESPNKIAYNWIDKTGEVAESYTFREFWSRIESIAWHIRNKWGAKKGDMILCCYPPGLDFIFAHFGVMLAGCIAVPVYPSELRGERAKKGVEKFALIAKDCKATLCLSTSGYLNPLRISRFISSALPWPNDVKWRATNDIRKMEYRLREAKPDDLAFLQYTSGSTSDPKGVMILHRNYLHNCLILWTFIATGSRDKSFFSWLPQYHDMGLVVFSSPIVGCTLYCMSPLTFIADPPLWMLSMSKYGCNVCAAPNFAYALTARKWDKARAQRSSEVPFDLSHVELIASGAEPVRYDDNQRFMDIFKHSGLRNGVIKPAYGLAEACVFVSIATTQRQQTLVADGKARICCGNVDKMLTELNTDIRIIDPDTGALVPDGHVGEICVSSRSVAAGYLGKPEKSSEIFRHTIPGVSGRTFLRTGDLGCIGKVDVDWCLNNPHSTSGLENEEYNKHELTQRHLIITGRAKDLIIVRGRNYYPQDIEMVVEQSLNPSKILREGCSIAFGIDDGHTEMIVCVVEVRRDGMKGCIKENNGDASAAGALVCSKIAQKVLTEAGCVPGAIVLIEERTIPKTTSGKVQRQKASILYQNGGLSIVYKWINPNVPSAESADDEKSEKSEELTDTGHYVPDNTDLPAICVVNDNATDGSGNCENADTNVSNTTVGKDNAMISLDAAELKAGSSKLNPFRLADLANVKNIVADSEDKKENDRNNGGNKQSQTKKLGSMRQLWRSLEPDGSKKSSRSFKLQSARSNRSFRLNKEVSDRAMERGLSSTSLASKKTPRSSTVASLIFSLLEKQVPGVERQIKEGSTFEHLGIDSVKAVEISTMLASEFGVELSPTVIYSFPTVESLAAHIVKEIGQMNYKMRASAGMEILAGLTLGQEATDKAKLEVAIVGVGCRLPGGIDNLRSFWGNLIHGVDLVKQAQRNRRHPEICGAFLSRDEIELFDNEFFGISKLEAQAMDPAQRLILTTAWEAVAMGGVKSKAEMTDKNVGVFVGMSSTEYRPPLTTPAALKGTSVHSALAANRVSFVLGTTGPSMTIDTACSSSLVALNVALQAIRAGDCSSAIVGGVNLMHNPTTFETLEESGFLSPTARCHTWDADADGYVRSEGCVSMYLVPLEDAILNDLNVLGVVEGAATGSDGRSLSLTAPNPVNQAKCIERALEDAGIKKTDVRFVEAHGTGTALGDPIEIDGLKRAYVSNSLRAHPTGEEDTEKLIVSSAKGYLGHTESAAGLTGVAKTIVSLIHGKVPGNPQLATINSKLMAKGCIVSPQMQPLPEKVFCDETYYAGVSSFGFGGALAHTIISDKDMFPPENLIEKSAQPVFLFAGQGPIDFHGGFVLDAYESISVYRETIDLVASKMDNGLAPYTLRQLLGIETDERIKSIDDATLQQYAQPCIFAAQMALVEVWKSRQIVPAMVMGHSVGEIAAAYCAGVMDLDTAIALVMKRFRAYNQCTAGVMMAIISDSKETMKSIIQYLMMNNMATMISAYNGPRQIIVSGLQEDIDAIAGNLEPRYSPTACRLRRLSTSGAFHSPLMHSAAEVVKSFLQNMKLRPAGINGIQMISTVSGKIETHAFADPSYWSNQVTKPVLFEQGSKVLAQTSNKIFVEIGPGRTAITMFRYTLEDQTGFELLTSFPVVDDNTCALEQINKCSALIDGWLDDSKKHGWNFERFPLHAMQFGSPPTSQDHDAACQQGQSLETRATRIRQDVTEMCKSLVSGVDIDDHTPFMNLGLDSLALTALTGMIQEKFQEEMTVSQLLKHNTIAKVCKWLISSMSKEERSTELVPLGPSKKDSYRLTSCQAQMYAHMSKFGDDSCMYHLPFTWEISGDFDIDSYRKAIWHLLEEHEALRTGIRFVNGHLKQVVFSASSLSEPSFFHVSDEKRNPNELIQELEEKLLRPFNYESGPLFRTFVYVLEGNRFIVSLCFHHLAVDGGSLVVIMNQIMKTYSDYRAKNQPPKRELLQPVDFALLETHLLETPSIFDPAVDYWLPMAKQAAANPMNLPYRSAAMTNEYGSRGMIGLEFQPNILTRVQRFVQDYNHTNDTSITPFVVFFATFQLALHQWSQNNIVNVGSLHVNRDAAWLETIGPLFNTTVFSFDVGSYLEESFPQFIGYVASIFEASRPHSWLPQGRLLSELRRRGHAIPHEGLYQVSFIYQNFARSASVEFPGTTSQRCERYLHSDNMMAEFPLVVELDAATTSFGSNQISESMKAGLAFASNRFSGDTVRRLGDRWLHILDTLFNGQSISKAPIRSLEHLFPDDVKTIVDSNNTFHSFEKLQASENTALNMLMSAVRKEPNRIALRIANEFMAYGQFWDEVQSLAHALKYSYNVQPESVICLSAERSFNLIVGIWGIMLAGGVYCPIHPAEGRDRVRSIIELTGCQVILYDSTSKTLFDGIDLQSKHILDINATVKDSRNKDHPDTHSLCQTIHPSMGAYCVFTSGSTGKPKGVLISHASLFNAIHARPVVKRDDVCLQFCRTTFDVHIGDIFCSLAVGATLCLITEAMVLDFEAVGKCFEKYRITTAQMVPSYAMGLFRFLEQLPANRKIDVSSLRALVTSGEKMDWSLVDQLRRVLPEDCRVINLYGPAEACVDATIYETVLSKTLSDPHRNEASVPIGKPLPNYTCYVLNKTLKPVSIGDEGELYIGGKGVFKEYLNQPELTNKALIRVALGPKICGNNPTAPLLYKTGDVVRQLQDGNLVFVGRTDFQVKIRGQRVELCEIEHAILKHGSVRDVVCMVKELNGSKDGQLVAYIVPDAFSIPNGGKIHHFELDPTKQAALVMHCEETLPHHMRPAIYVGMSALPLNQNMKVDRKQLPVPFKEWDRLQASRPMIPISGTANMASHSQPPLVSTTTGISGITTGTERKLSRLWCQTLQLNGCEELKPCDDFFAIGGSSLSAAELAGLVRNTGLCTTISVLDIFEHTKLSELAAHIDSVNGVEPRIIDGATSATHLLLQPRDDNMREAHYHTEGEYPNLPFVPRMVTPTQTEADILQGQPVPTSIRHMIQISWWLSMMLCLGAGFIPVTQILRFVINERDEIDTSSFLLVFVTFIAGSAMYGLLFALFVLAVKWAVLGQTKEGTYRMWSPYMLRWWCVNSLVSIGIKFIGFFLQDTALFRYWLGWLGARIGNNVILDTTKFGTVDLLSIGDGCVIEGQSSLLCHSFSNVNNEMVLVLGEIKIRKNVYLNFKVAIEPDTCIPDYVELESGATVTRHMVLEEGMTYSNSPLWVTGRTDQEQFHRRTDTRKAITYSGATTFLQVLGMIYYFSVFLGGLVLGLWPANSLFELWADQDGFDIISICFLLTGTPLIMLAFFCYSIPVTKLLILGKVSEGRQLLTPWLFARLWLCNRFMSTCSWLLPSLGTPAMNNLMYSLMGLKLGDQCQSTLANFSACMDLIKLGDRCWLGANNVCVPWYFDRCDIVFAPIVMESGAVLSPNCITLAGATLRKRAVLGPSSVVRQHGEVKTGEVYMNQSVMMKVPTAAAGDNDDDDDVQVERNPTLHYCFFQVRLLILQFATYALLGICSIPAAYIFKDVVLELTGYEETFELAEPVGHWMLIPMQHWGITFLMYLTVLTFTVYTIVVAMIVRCIRNRDNRESKYFFNHRFMTFLWEGHLLSFSLLSNLHASHLLLRGTELLPLLARLMGAKVGRGVYWDAIQPTEFDLVSIGDDSILDQCDIVVHGVTGVRQSHVLTQEPIVVGKRCVLRPGCYPLPPVLEMGDDCTIGTNSVVMKGDVIPSGSTAIGNPARILPGLHHIQKDTVLMTNKKEPSFKGAHCVVNDTAGATEEMEDVSSSIIYV